MKLDFLICLAEVVIFNGVIGIAIGKQAMYGGIVLLQQTERGVGLATT